MTSRTLANHTILIAGVVFLFLPIVVMLMSSTHSSGTLRTEGMQLLPGGAAQANYGRVFTLEAGFTDRVTALQMLKNSLILGLGTGVLTTAFSLGAAYTLVFFKLRWAGFVFWLTLVTLLFPLEARFINTFEVTSDLGLINTHLGLILPTLSLALGTFFYRQYFLTIPPSYLEASILDGAGPVRFFVDFIVPLSWPRTWAVFAISFIIGWNQYLWPLMISTDDGLYTMVRGIRLLGQNSGPGMAFVVLSILPPLVLLFVFHRTYFTARSET